MYMCLIFYTILKTYFGDFIMKYIRDLGRIVCDEVCLPIHLQFFNKETFESSFLI